MALRRPSGVYACERGRCSRVSAGVSGFVRAVGWWRCWLVGGGVGWLVEVLVGWWRFNGWNRGIYEVARSFLFGFPGDLVDRVLTTSFLE